MWLVMLAGLPGVGKSHFRNYLVQAAAQYVFEMSSHYDGDPIDEDELATKNYLNKFKIVQASSDDIIDLICGGQGRDYTEMYNQYSSLARDGFWHRLRLAAATRTTLIVADRTLITEDQRLAVINAVREECPDYKVVMIDFFPPNKEEWERRLNGRPGKIIPPEVMESMAAARTYASDDAFQYYKLITMSYPVDVSSLTKHLFNELMLAVPELN